MKKVMYGERKGILIRVDVGLHRDLVRLYGLELKGIKEKRGGFKAGMSFNRYLEVILGRYVEGGRDLLRVYDGVVGDSDEF